MSSLCNTSQVAALLGVTPRRVQALIASGRLPARKLGGLGDRIQKPQVGLRAQAG